MLKQLKRKGILALACVISIFSMSVCAFAKPDWPLDTGCQSEAGIVMDLDSGAVLFAQNIHVQEYPASITKLLTALVVVENTSMDEQVTFSHDAVYNVESGSGNKLQLEEGDVLSVKDCLYVMLLQSSNQAANALAEHVGGSREAFADMMNEKAASLGCRESHFVNPSGLNDPEQLTGSSRVYANAKPGIIMEAFAAAGESNLVFIINELDKAASGKGNGNPADVLLTLLDNLGFTDNYIECNVPTVGVYPIATANEKDQISAPIMSRFAVIDIPDYTPEEKKIIFSRFALPKILKRMSLRRDECTVTDEGLDVIIELYSNTSGIRDLEQAAEHIAANALYQIEVNHVKEVVFDGEAVRALLS